MNGVLKTRENILYNQEEAHNHCKRMKLEGVHWCMVYADEFIVIDKPDCKSINDLLMVIKRNLKRIIRPNKVSNGF